MSRAAVPEQARSAAEERRGFVEDLPTLLLAVAIALAIRTFVFQSFYVPSDSMFPTLLIGDHVFVSKLAYGPRVPFTEIQLPGYREPRRGDVVVFQLAREGGHIYPPDRRRDLPTEAFIKRLVALPGETIELRHGVVFVDGVEAPQTPTGETFRDRWGASSTCSRRRSAPAATGSSTTRASRSSTCRRAAWSRVASSSWATTATTPTTAAAGAASRGATSRVRPASSTGPGTGRGAGSRC